ncbi:hypothetical protein [Chitinimonas taiwanensis]|uniref:hypothetical protein n=1 Tax=Chitinimonas taiwanensis TaxID=240412 RepID=UPI0035B1F208
MSLIFRATYTMKPYIGSKNRYRGAAVALALLANCLALAQAPQDDESKLITKVRADGTLFGFAQACKLTQEEIKDLFDLKLAATRELVQSKVPHYTPEHFKADFRNGIEIAKGFVRLTDPESDAYKRNCEDIQQKVKSLLQKK